MSLIERRCPLYNSFQYDHLLGGGNESNQHNGFCGEPIEKRCTGYTTNCNTVNLTEFCPSKV